jgi:hypothetical protein
MVNLTYKKSDAKSDFMLISKFDNNSDFLINDVNVYVSLNEILLIVPQLTHFS